MNKRECIFFVNRVVEKCVFISPRGNYLMLQTNLNELIIVQTESGAEVIESSQTISGAFL